MLAFVYISVLGCVPQSTRILVRRETVGPDTPPGRRLSGRRVSCVAHRERKKERLCVSRCVYICDREKERDRERDDNLAVHCTCPYYSRLVSSSRYALTDTRTIIYFIRNGSQTQSSSPPPETRVRAENSAQNKRTRPRRLYTYR